MAALALPALLGVLAGALGGLMGVGGGILLVPLLVHVLRRTQHEAHGTSLGFVAVSAVVAVIPYFAAHTIQVPLAAWLAAGAVPGVVIGAWISRRLSGRRLRQAFGLLLAATAIRILAVPPAPHPVGVAWPAAANALLGAGVGVLGGLLGVGGGVILVPVLVLGQRMEQHTAQGVSLLMIIPTAIVGALSHARHGQVVRALLPGLALGGVAGATAGAILAHRIDAPALSRLFALFLLPVSAQMLFGRRRDSVASPPITEVPSS
jgi:uncharacterized protein